MTTRSIFSTNNNQSENIINNIIPTIKKSIKHLRLNYINEIMYKVYTEKTENFKILIKYVKDDLNK